MIIQDHSAGPFVEPEYKVGHVPLPPDDRFGDKPLPAVYQLGPECKSDFITSAIQCLPYKNRDAILKKARSELSVFALVRALERKEITV